MTRARTPYDEYPYRSYPIEWSAPERLALTSLLHGGPRVALDAPYRVLEIGCGDGANLVPLAYYRPHAHFVGVDAAATRIDIARRKQRVLGLQNIELLACDVRSAANVLDGEFDVIIAHGVFSWIPLDARDALLALCSTRLRDGGLWYLNYNAKPGWNVRGLVREFLLTQTARGGNRASRTEMARDLATRMADHFSGADHPYSRLMANEFRFVGECDASHTAHEYLSADNHAYSRDQFLTLAAAFGFVHVADADFNYPSGRLPEQLPAILAALQITEATDAASDLLSYRQLHSPLLTKAGWRRRLPDVSEFACLRAASRLDRHRLEGDGTVFTHPSGAEAVVTSQPFARALEALRATWPEDRSVEALFTPMTQDVCDDLLLMYRQGILELRLSCCGDGRLPSEALHATEKPDGYVTDRWHRVEHVSCTTRHDCKD